MKISIYLLLIVWFVPCFSFGQADTSGWINKGRYLEENMKTSEILLVKYSYDGKSLYTISRDSVLRVWNVSDGSLIKEHVLPMLSTDIDINRKGNRVVLIRQRSENQGINYDIYSIDPENDQTELLFTGDSSTYYMYGLEGMGITLSESQDYLLIDYSLEEILPTVENHTGRLDLFDLKNKRFIKQKIHWGHCLFNKFSNDGNFFISQYKNTYFQRHMDYSEIYRLITAKTDGTTINISKDEISAAAISPDSKFIATITEDKMLNIYTPSLIKYDSLKAQITLTPSSLTVTNNYRLIGVEIREGNLYVCFFNSEDGSIIDTISMNNPYNSFLTDLSPDGSSFVIASDQSIRLFKPEILTKSLIALFDADRTTAQTGDTINFINKSYGSPSKWKWNFGDGTFSDLENPFHIYKEPGNYFIKLVVSDINRNDSIMKYNYIQISGISSVEKQDLIKENSVAVYPNPISKAAIFSIDLIASSYINLSLFNDLGQKVATLIDDTRDKGKIELICDGSYLLPGLYYYCFQSDNKLITGKFILIK